MSRLLGVLAEGPLSIDDKRSLCGGDHALFGEIAEAACGTAIVARARRGTARSAGPGSGVFRVGRWLFAHDGTVDDLAFVRSRTSPTRLRACASDTTTEILFAFLLTRLDERGCTDELAGDTTDATVAAAACELARAGSLSFVLTDGVTLYAHRLGRSLFFLERPASQGLPAAQLLASDRLTADPWTPLLDGTLLRCRRGRERLERRFLAGWDPLTPPPSDIELPFTD